MKTNGDRLIILTLSALALVEFGMLLSDRLEAPEREDRLFQWGRESGIHQMVRYILEKRVYRAPVTISGDLTDSIVLNITDPGYAIKFEGPNYPHNISGSTFIMDMGTPEIGKDVSGWLDHKKEKNKK